MLNSLKSIIGKSQSIRNLISFIKKASESNQTVLLLGETGVGKGLAARSIHALSPRNEKVFIKLNCCNFNDNLMESELFGHIKGAFTGAFFNRAGLFESANEGTLLLDEIGDLDLRFQAKLLSVIEDKEIRKIGDNTFKKINTRIICATNKNLQKLVLHGYFREDLFFRINILTFNIHPLRERREDIPILTDELLHKINEEKNSSFTISQTAMNKLLQYTFPGNIRELDNILRRAVEMETLHVIQEKNILFYSFPHGNCEKTRSKYDRKSTVDIITNFNGNKSRAAKSLGISRVHLYRILKNKEGSI